MNKLKHMPRIERDKIARDIMEAAEQFRIDLKESTNEEDIERYQRITDIYEEYYYGKKVA